MTFWRRGIDAPLRGGIGDEDLPHLRAGDAQAWLTELRTQVDAFFFDGPAIPVIAGIAVLVLLPGVTKDSIDGMVVQFFIPGQVCF